MNEVTRPEVNYTQVPNGVLKDKRLSLKAKGIYAYLYSKPDHWQFSGDRICNETSCGRKVVYSALAELEAFQYLKRVKRPDGRITYFLDMEPVDRNGQQVQEPIARFGKVPKRQSAETGSISNTVGLSKTDDLNNTESEQSSQGKEIAEAIKAFETINPLKVKSWYGNKTQRECVRNLINHYGKDRLLKIISILPQTNMMKYFPRITTPYALELKAADLEAKLKEKNYNNGLVVI